MKYLKKYFEAMNEVEKAIYPSMFLLIIYGQFLARVNLEFFDASYTLRNGFICSLEQLSLFLSMCICFFRAYKFLKNKIPVEFICCLFLGIVFLFGFGEKIRWGQFIFNLELPSFFKSYNKQSQITVHNLVINGVNINKLVFGKILAVITLFYLLAIPYLHQKKIKFKKIINKLAVPVPQKHQIILYVAGAILALTIPANKKGEILQFCGTWSFLLILAYPKNKEVFKS